MFHRSSVLSQSLNSTLETFSFGDCGSVHFVAHRKNVSLNLSAQAVFPGIFQLKFPDISLSAHTRFLTVSHDSLVCAMHVNYFFLAAGILVYNHFLLVNKANLHCFITVIFLSLNLKNRTGAGLKDCHRNQHTVFSEDLSHSDFRR